MSLHPTNANNTCVWEIDIFIFEAKYEYFSYTLLLIHWILKHADIMISKTQEPFEN
jgi:hypothetical protein